MKIKPIKAKVTPNAFGVPVESKAWRPRLDLIKAHYPISKDSSPVIYGKKTSLQKLSPKGSISR